MMKRASLLICVLPLALGGCGGVRNWFAGTPMSDQQMQQAQVLSPQDRDLKVAMDVVQTRLREADESGDYSSLRPVQPQIYKLANALLPHASQQQVITRPVPTPTQVQPQQAAIMSQQTYAPVQSQPTHNMAPAHTMQPIANPPFPGASVQPAAMHKPVQELAGAFKPAPMLANSRSLYHAVQLGAYRSEARAMAGWHELQAQAHGELAGLSTRTERVDLGSKGVFYRLKAGPFASSSEAMARCHSLAANGIACLGTDFTGKPAG